MRFPTTTVLFAFANVDCSALEPLRGGPGRDEDPTDESSFRTAKSRGYPSLAERSQCSASSRVSNLRRNAMLTEKGFGEERNGSLRGERNG
ncbi:MAG: hypothetical protein CO108_26885 [Deltaproteobacteria bacterium CG_4_9_14_3_um_filter_63_12]|nr:MAG: hypothetical protein COW42_11865 [Deltaproteobacteria bacterium CG17_big_fil_post_rev_8_21_14_2_50_63_7]PJB34941.1 MAG: hypothetical protein CO108_26885 [Deltaproteobacteria bacterium CG_4_9_14_3_um_filter_63_12]